MTEKFIKFSFKKINIVDGNKKLIGLPNWKDIERSDIKNSDRCQAIICGKKSGITVFDFDNIDTYNKIIEKIKILKKCYTVSTTRGKHIYFKYDKDLRTGVNVCKDYEGIDIRNDGSFVICCDGTENGYKVDIGEIVDIPIELKNIIHNLSIGERNLTDLVMKIDKKRADNYDDWLKIGFIIFNEGGTFEIFDKFSKQSIKYNFEEVEKKWNSFKTFDGVGLSIATLHKMIKDDNCDSKYDILKNLSTGGLSDYFKKNYSNNFIYSKGNLYFFNDIYWKEDFEFSYLHNFIDSIFHFEILLIYQEFERKNINSGYKDLQEIRKGIDKMRNHSFRSLLVKDICIKLVNDNILWNQETELFCFENKIYNLTENKFVEPKPEYFINMSCGWSYDEKYDISLINELEILIEKIFPESEIKNLYLSILSTGLSGQHLEKFIIANGRGGNGKGVLNDLMLELCGNYSYILPSSILLDKISTGPNPDIANCNNKRFVVAREPDAKYRLNCSTIKDITGGGKFNARLNYSNDCETNLRLTMIMECNDKPIMSESNDAMVRRIIDIPFISSFVDKHIYDELSESERKNIFIGDTYYKTKNFKNKFKQALFLILTKYYKALSNTKFQLLIPSTVNERNMNYISSGDDIFTFVCENFEKTENKNDKIWIKDLYELYKNSDYFVNLSKSEKRQNNYKNFQTKMSNNLFLRKYVKEDTDKRQLNLIKHKLKTDEKIKSDFDL